MNRIELKHLLKNLPFTRENFELLKEKVLKDYEQEQQMKEAGSMAEQLKFAKPKITGIDRRFQEDMIDAEFSEMDMMDEW